MSKYLSKAINKINRKNTKTQRAQKVTSSIMASDDVHRIASRQPQLYKINQVPSAPRITMTGHWGNRGLA